MNYKYIYLIYFIYFIYFIYRRDFLREDFLREDFLREDFLRRDFLPRDFLPRDFLREDFLREDFLPRDFLFFFNPSTRDVIFTVPTTPFVTSFITVLPGRPSDLSSFLTNFRELLFAMSCLSAYKLAGTTSLLRAPVPPRRTRR